MHHVREDIMSAWERFKAGQISLITAAVTTNTALELLRKPQEDIVKSVLPAFDNSLPQLLFTLYNVLHFTYTAGSVVVPPLWDEIDDRDILATTIYDHLLLPISQEFHGLADLGVDYQIPISKAGYFVQYQPSQGARDSAFSKRWHQSQILICETSTEYLPLMALGQIISRNPALQTGQADNGQPINIYFFDEMAVEMDHLRQTKIPSLLLLIYGQIFVDINLVLGITAKRGLNELREDANEMLTTLEKRSRQEPPTVPKKLPTENEEIIKAFKYELNCWRSVSTVDEPERGQSTRKATIFERNPMLCGLIQFRLRLNYQDIGFKLVNSFATVLSTAHLYAACRVFGIMPGTTMPVWADMDLVLEIHGKDDIFGGKYPDNIDDSFTACHYMMSYSTQAIGALRHFGTGNAPPSYLRERTRDATLMAKSGAKFLKDHTQNLPIFSNKYLRNPTAGTAFDINTVKQLLADIQAKQQNSTRKNAKVLKVRRQRKHKSPKFSILQIISLLEAGLEAETASIRFNYISMHLRCCSILKQVQLSADDYIVGKMGPCYLDNDAQLPYIVGYILQFAAFSARAALMVGFKREGNDGLGMCSKRLVDATSVIRDYLQKMGEGDSEIKKIG